jgi:thiol-disulfide isomerase/thioredoxin
MVGERFNAKPGMDGRLDYLATRQDTAQRLRIEAAGYRTQTGPEFKLGDDSPRTQDFRLQPSQPVSGVVLDASGKPVAKAQVLMATAAEEARIGELSDNVSNNHVTATDAAGHFEFPDPGEPFMVVAQTDSEFAMAEFAADRHDVGPIRLQPWASIAGQFHDSGQPIKGAAFIVDPVCVHNVSRPRLDTQLLQCMTDKDGRFEFPRVPPLPVAVRALLGPWRDEGYRSGPSVPLELKSGQHAKLNLGRDGVIVAGKVRLTGTVPSDLDCTYSLNHLVSRQQTITPPAEIARLGFDIRKGWQFAWRKTIEGSAYLSSLQHWFVKLTPAGTFRISGVPPGEYDLAIEVYAKPSGCLVDPLGQKVVRVTITTDDVNRGELTLPEISVPIVPVPAVGDIPALPFQHPDDTSGSLSDFRGHYTVVHFWASWCGPCKEHLPALRQLQARFGISGLAVLGVSLDDDAAAWQSSLKRLDMRWPQGRLATAHNIAVSTVPAYWLLDPSGKILAKANDPEELAAAASKAGLAEAFPAKEENPEHIRQRQIEEGMKADELERSTGKRHET